MPRTLTPTRRVIRLAAILTLGLALAACATSYRPQLGPGPPVIRPTEISTLGVAPIKGPDVTVAFATASSIPGEFDYALQDALVQFAEDRDLTIVDVDDPKATYRMLGYVSAIGDVNRVQLVYTWDVFDPNGTRIHRFTGQEPAGSGGADPWTAVTVGVIEDAARETIDAVADWLRP